MDLLELAKAIGGPSVIAILLILTVRQLLREAAKFFTKLVESMNANTTALVKCSETLERVVEHIDEERPILEAVLEKLECAGHPGNGRAQH